MSRGGAVARVSEPTLLGTVHDDAYLERPDLVEGARGGNSGGTVSGPKTMGFG